MGLRREHEHDIKKNSVRSADEDIMSMAAAKWRTRIAMTLAKRGAQVAIRSSHAFQCSSTSPYTHRLDLQGDDDGPMNAFVAEPRIEMLPCYLKP